MYQFCNASLLSMYIYMHTSTWAPGHDGLGAVSRLEVPPGLGRVGGGALVAL